MPQMPGSIFLMGQRWLPPLLTASQNIHYRKARDPGSTDRDPQEKGGLSLNTIAEYVSLRCIYILALASWIIRELSINITWTLAFPCVLYTGKPVKVFCFTGLISRFTVRCIMKQQIFACGQGWLYVSAGQVWHLWDLIVGLYFSVWNKLWLYFEAGMVIQSSRAWCLYLLPRPVQPHPFNFSTFRINYKGAYLSDRAAIKFIHKAYFPFILSL